MEITYWGYYPQDEDLVAAFNKQHDDIQVNLKQLGGDYMQAIHNALEAGTTPDVAAPAFDQLPELRAAGALRDISSCPGVEELSTKVLPWTWDQVTMGSDGVFAVPWNVAPMGMWYRTDLFRDGGLPIPTTWGDYYNAAKELRSEYDDTYITNFNSGHALNLIGLLWQAGARPFRYEGDRVVIDLVDDKGQKVVDFWQRMIDEGLVDVNTSPFTPAEFKKWTDGTLATNLGAAWLPLFMEPNAPQAAGKWSAAPLPQWDPGHPQGANLGGGGAAAVLEGTDHPAEAAEVAAWLATSDFADSVLATSTPATIEGQNLPTVEQPVKYFGGDRVYEVFRNAAKTVDTGFQWAPNMTYVNSALSDALVAATSGDKSLNDALDEAQARIVDNLEAQGFEVASN